MTKYFAALLMFFVAWPTVAADVNGYTAKYAKPIGTPPACSAIIDSVNDPDWAKLNDPSYQVICIAPGDYSAKGSVTLTALGAAGKERWLLYYSSSDTNQDPWDQQLTNRAKLGGLILRGAAHWIIHRITIDGDGASYVGVVFEVGTGVNNMTFNRVLIEDFSRPLVQMRDNGPEITIQNSVIRSARTSTTVENQCIELNSASGVRIVNNEISNCHKLISSGSGNISILGAKIENNDLYVTRSQYTDCNGNYTPDNPNSPCSTTEAIISLKSGGIFSQPVEIVHNRLWGVRRGDGNLIGSANSTSGSSVTVSNFSDNTYPDGRPGYPGADYVLIKNNVIMDAQAGIKNFWGIPDHISIIGNLIYDIRQHDPARASYAINLNRADNVEVYLNTIVNAESTWLMLGSEAEKIDILCNAVINSGAMKGSTLSTTVANNNAYYATSPYTANSSNINIVKPKASDSGNLEYCFYRKLHTGPEKVCIPYVTPTTTSPHYAACKVDIGSRPDIGINDSKM